MYVESSTDIRPEVKSLMERNPFTARVTEITSLMSSLQRTLTENEARVENYKREVIGYQTSASIARQKIRNLDKEKEALAKVLSSNEGASACTFLNTKDLQAFFESLGMLFVSLSIKQNGDSAKLTYIRPSRAINSMPVSPMVITIEYQKRDGELALKKFKAYLLFLVESSNSHPHISGSSICMGNYYDICHKEKYSLCLDGYQDQVLLMETLLSTYNDESPYMRVDEIVQKMAQEGIRYNETDTVEIDNYATYTFRNSKLSVAQGAYSLKALVPRKMAEDYYKKISEMNASIVVDDFAATLLTYSWEDMDRDEIYSEICEFQGTARGLLPAEWFVKLVKIIHFCEEQYNEDDDCYEPLDEISSDNAEDICKSWASVISEYANTGDAKNKGVTLRRLPDLDVIYRLTGGTNVSN